MTTLTSRNHDHVRAGERVQPERRASESRRVLLLLPTLAAVLALWLLVQEGVRHNETRAERDEARAEVAKLQDRLAKVGPVADMACRWLRNGIYACINSKEKM